MKKNIDFLLQQRGGMLVELMMSLAIAAIMIPFLFRYQQNTVERARNIAVNKQMEAVQSALEKHIVQNRASYMRHSGNHTWADVHLCNLIDAKFLPDDFSNDCTNCYSGCTARKSDATDFGTYSLRVLKTQGAGGHDVLQGVVLLSNDDTPLRTREIVNLGGGKIGYIDGTNVRGGFNVFVRPKTDMGLNNATAGLVGSTRTLRGNNEYLWRQGRDDLDSAENATMQSPLNLDGHDIVNIKDAYVSRAVFNTELDAKSVLIRNALYFLNTQTFYIGSGAFTFHSDYAIVRGLVDGTDNSTLTINGNLYISGSGSLQIGADNLVSNNMLDMNYITGLTELKVGETNKPATFNILTSTAQLGAKAVHAPGRSINIIDANDIFAGVTPRLTVGNQILPAQENNPYYWNIQEQKVYLPNVALTNLPRILGFARCYTHDCKTEGSPLYPSDDLPQGWVQTGDAQFGVLSDAFLFEGGDKITKNTPLIRVLNVNLCKIKKVIKAKLNCLLSTGWDSTDCKAVIANFSSPTYDSYFTSCTASGFDPNPDDDEEIVEVYPDPDPYNLIEKTVVDEEQNKQEEEQEKLEEEQKKQEEEQKKQEEEQKKQEEEQKKQEEQEKQNQQGDDVIHIRSL